MRFIFLTLVFVLCSSAMPSHVGFFISDNWDAAEEGAYDVPVKFALAQAALESGWGRSRGAKEANAYFGIKGKYDGDSYVNADGVARKYPNRWHSYRDYRNYLYKSPYYDAAEWCDERAAGSEEYEFNCWAHIVSRSYLGPKAPISRKDGYERKLKRIYNKYLKHLHPNG